MSAVLDHLHSQLPDIGDGLQVAFPTLHEAPEPPSCEQLAIRLHGAVRHVLALADALKRSDPAPD